MVCRQLHGARVYKTFGGRCYEGTAEAEPGTDWLRVSYEDGDEEQLSCAEVLDHADPPADWPRKRKYTTPTAAQKRRRVVLAHART